MCLAGAPRSVSCGGATYSMFRCFGMFCVVHLLCRTNYSVLGVAKDSHRAECKSKKAKNVFECRRGNAWGKTSKTCRNVQKFRNPCVLAFANRELLQIRSVKSHSKKRDYPKVKSDPLGKQLYIIWTDTKEWPLFLGVSCKKVSKQTDNGEYNQ